MKLATTVIYWKDLCQSALAVAFDFLACRGPTKVLDTAPSRAPPPPEIRENCAFNTAFYALHNFSVVSVSAKYYRTGVII